MMLSAVAAAMICGVVPALRRTPWAIRPRMMKLTALLPTELTELRGSVTHVLGCSVDIERNDSEIVAERLVDGHIVVWAHGRRVGDSGSPVVESR